MASPRVLIRSATVITMDRQLGVLDSADVLLEDDLIAAVSHEISADDCEIIDASHSIVMPGFVDTHRHLWQTNLRAICADWSLHQYMRGIRFNISPFFRPDDVHAGNYVGALEAINAGVTTVFDYSHSNNSPDHANAGIEALLATGIRAVYGYGFVPAPLDEPVFKSVEDRVADAKRVQEEYLPSASSLVVMGTALTEIGLIPLSENRREVEASREMGVLQSIHNNNYWGSSISKA